MKTMIFYIRKGARKPKMQGLASAPGSVWHIADMSRIAMRGEGYLFIVDGPTAEHGRRLIADYRAKRHPDIGGPGMTSTMGDGRVVAIGAMACQAIAGASEGARHWDQRLNRDGIVKIADTRAIGTRSDNIQPTMDDYFGRGFDRK